MYQSLSMVLFANPYFEVRFSGSCHLSVFSRSSSIRIKGIRLPPPYTSYGRAYTSHSHYIARKAVSVFAVIDIAYHYYSVTHNAL